MPAVATLYRDELEDAGIDVVGISQFNTTEAATIAFVERNNMTFPNLYDDNALLAGVYQVPGVPTYVFLDQEGRIAHTSSGARGVALIESVLTQLAAEQRVE